MHPKGADRMANIVDPEGPVWSGSILFAQTCLSEILESVRYFMLKNSVLICYDLSTLWNYLLSWFYIADLIEFCISQNVSFRTDRSWQTV